MYIDDILVTGSTIEEHLHNLDAVLDCIEYGLGAVLSHVLEDGQEKPIAYTSRTLNPAERWYSQLEGEGL